MGACLISGVEYCNKANLKLTIRLGQNFRLMATGVKSLRIRNAGVTNPFRNQPRESVRKLEDPFT